LKKTIKIVLLFSVLGLSNTYASGSQFGLINQSLGNIVLPYSASGVSRSYEIAHMDSMQLNMKNFATWTDISRTTLFLNSGYDAIFGENRVETSFIEKANFQGVAIGIPLIKRELTFGIGLQPFTTIEHRVFNTLDQGGYDITENYYISGGLSKANFNFAYKINDLWAVALGYEFTFGRIDRQIKSAINTPVSSQIEMSIKNQFSGHGVILSVISSPLPDLKAGLMLKPAVQGKLTKSGNSASEALNKQEILDTSIPTEINFGLEYNLSDIYALGFDVTYQDWKKGYEIDGANIDDYNTYYYLGFGFERKGSNRRFVKYLEQIDYRAGLFYSQLAYLNNTESVMEYGFSAGLSVPIQRFQSKIDLGGFISQRGELSKNALQETIVGIRVSISASETWFVNLED
jgi:hypothetical protein